MKQYKVIISGGGTGGHIFPAISIANTLKKRMPDVQILFVGAQDRMEMDKVPAAGYEIVGLPVKGFDRAHLLNNIKVVRCLLKSLSLAKKTIRDFLSLRSFRQGRTFPFLHKRRKSGRLSSPATCWSRRHTSSVPVST